MSETQIKSFFITKIRPRDKEKCRKLIGISSDVKGNFKANQDVKVILESTGKKPTKKSFVATIRNTKGSGTFIELPSEVRDSFQIEQEVKVTLELISLD